MQTIAFVATSQPDRSKSFYSEILKFTLIEDSPYALVFDANGTMLRIQKVETVTLAPYTALGWKVPDIHGKVQELGAMGVTMERFQWIDQDASGVWTTPDGSGVSWFRDPDGNLLSLTQFNA
ncbi:MAG TPA: VOC family protein [Caballeronia sp.]|nr:VOC family protein [Caballeronia sp.]